MNLPTLEDLGADEASPTAVRRWWEEVEPVVAKLHTLGGNLEGDEHNLVADAISLIEAAYHPRVVD